MKKEIHIDGNIILSEEDFYKVAGPLLGFPDYFGNNLDALWDSMSGHIDTDIILVWDNHSISKNAFPETFEKIVEIFDETKDIWSNFEYQLC